VKSRRDEGERIGLKHQLISIYINHKTFNFNRWHCYLWASNTF